MRETRFYISTTGSKIVYHVTANKDNEEKKKFFAAAYEIPCTTMHLHLVPVIFI